MQYVEKENANNSFQVGIYIRLSREDEDRSLESESVTSQRDLLLAYVRENKYILVDEYVDDGYTGTQFDRPAFQRMMRDIESKKINMVITKDLSRLGRNNGKVSTYLDEYFPKWNVRYIALNDHYDSFLESPNNDMIAFKSVFNDYYCGDISKKVRSGLKTRKEKGWFTGWKAPYGYQLDEKDKHHLIVDPVASKTVKRIFDLAYQGKSARQISNILTNDKIPTPSFYANLSQHKNTLNLWCTRTVMEILTNPTYTGSLAQGRRKKVNYKIKKEVRVPKSQWIIVSNTHEAIVDQYQFETIQNLVTKNKRISLSRPPKLLYQFLYCKECGHAITIQSRKGRNRSYCTCSFYRKYSKQKLCTPHSMSYEQLEDAILNKLLTLIQAQFSKVHGIQSLQTYLKRVKTHPSLENKIKLIEREVSVIKDTMAQTYIDFSSSLIDQEQYELVMKKLKIQIEPLEQDLKTFKKKSRIVGACTLSLDQIVNQFLEQITIDRPMLADLIDSVSIAQDKKLSIYFKFCLLES